MNASPTAQVQTVPIDLRQDWPAALREAGFDAGKSTAWTAEGLLPFLPSAAQDRLLDNITALSADDSRLASEVAVMPNSTDGNQLWDAMDEITKRWQEHGFDIELGQLGYSDERHDVGEYLDGRGWSSVQTRLQDLLVAAGLPKVPQVDGEAAFGDNYYCTSVKSR